ncbi:MAG: serine/threonine protein kinase [Candidatus Hydrogenedentes bacterium]|nr:serine/threonine protein kinase [Candidatus Hydrogenedentota bacterium]
MGPYQHEVQAIAGDKYEVLRELGRGGMGVVYLARDTTLQRDVAVKVMRASFVAEPHYVEQFRREAQVVARLTHPNIVHINALEVREERLLIEMPYLRGGSLRDRMQRGMTTVRFIRVMHDALKALACCHAEGIVHRDVKPSNFLFDSEGQAKLSDFGAATLAEGEWESDLRHSRASVIFIGTPQYACPEAWGGKEPLPSWDLYSLGMIAREAFLGELPAAPTPLSFLQGILTQPLPPLAECGASISTDLAVLIEQMTARDPQARLSDATEALARLCETPEFDDAARGKDDTVLMPRAGLPRRSTTRWPTLRLGAKPIPPWLRQSAWVVLALLLAGASLALAPRLRSASPALPPDEALEVAAVTQRSAFVHDTPAEADLLQLVREPSAQRVAMFALTCASTPGAQGHLLRRRGSDGNADQALGRVADRLIGLQLRATEAGPIEATGWWGEYVDSAGRGPRFGWAKGTAVEPAGSGGALWLDLQLASETDIETWQEKYFAVPEPAGRLTDTAFIHALEASPVLMPLLFNEILPRDLDKEINLAGLLPALHGAYTAVVPVSSETVPVVDGAVGEWPPLDAGLKGRPDRNQPRLAAAASDAGLYLAWQSENAAASEMRLELALLPLYRVPAPESPYLIFRHATAQQDLVWMDGGEALPVVGSVQFAERKAGTQWSAELFIPYDTIPDLPPIERETVMRLNAALFSPDSPAPLAVWGWPDLGAVQHGALLFFNPARAGSES